LRQQHNPSSVVAPEQVGNGWLGQARTLIRRIDAQIIDDFGEPSFSFYHSEDQNARGGGSAFGNEEVWDGSILCIAAEEYPWAVRTIPEIKSGTENQLK